METLRYFTYKEETYRFVICIVENQGKNQKIIGRMFCNVITEGKHRITATYRHDDGSNNSLYRQRAYS